MEVPKDIETCIEDQLQELIDNNDIPENYGYDQEVEKIEYKGYDGFIPYTNGGYRITLYSDLSSVNSSGSYPANKEAENVLSEAIDESLKDSLIDFIENNRGQLQKIYPAKNFEINRSDSYDQLYDLCNYHDLYDVNQSTLAEKLSEYEYTYLSEGCTFAYQFTVFYFDVDNSRNKTGEKELYFFCGVNTDYEYLRDKGLITTYEQNIPLSELTIDKVKEVINNMAKSI